MGHILTYWIMEAQRRAIEVEPDGAVLMLGGNVAGEILSHLK